MGMAKMSGGVSVCALVPPPPVLVLCRANRHEADDHKEASQPQALPRLPSHTGQEEKDHHMYPPGGKERRSWGGDLPQLY